MAYDPYYNQYQSLRSQEALTGRTGDASAQTLADIIRGNIAQDQATAMQAADTQSVIESRKQGLAIQQQNADLNAQKLKMQEKQQKQQALSSTVGGISNMALQMPQTLRNLGITGTASTTNVAAPAITSQAMSSAVAGIPIESTVAASTAGLEAGSEAAGWAAYSGGAAAAEESGLLGLDAVYTGYAEAATEMAVEATTLAATEAVAAYAATDAAVIAAADVIGAEAVGIGGEEMAIVAIALWVLCSELARQGKLDKSIAKDEWRYISENITFEEYVGYRIIALPMVGMMQKSGLVTRILEPLIKAFAYEMASRVNPKIEGSKLGAIILKLGLPLCRFAARMKYSVLEVLHG